MSQEKTYQVTYKVFSHTKIKQVDFHGKKVYPLYIQLIYDRRNTVYKSNLFDQFLKPKYGIRVAGQLYPPHLDQIIAKEEKLVEFIIRKHPDDFSFEIFKKEYDYYSRDLLDELEPGFIQYLYLFFHDEGMPYLAEALQLGTLIVEAGELVLDFRRSLKPELYAKLIENSFYHAPPYWPLFQFLNRNPRRGIKSLTIMEWNDTAIKQQFEEFFKKVYPNINIASVIDSISFKS